MNSDSIANLSMNKTSPSIALLIPCYNEAVTIAKVIDDFRSELPDLEVYVFDNNSNDNTAEIAQSKGVKVYPVNRQGKGFVVCSMFRLVDADIYIMVDGDDTYPAEEVHKLLEPVINESADMVCGDRISNESYSTQNSRAFHQFGNFVVTGLISLLFGVRLKDTMTGYRVFNRRFVKSLPILSKGFEIEVELTMTSVHYNYRIIEKPIKYRERPSGSFSKLNTFKDGFRIIAIILDVFGKYKPLTLFGSLAALFSVASLFIGVPVVLEFFDTGLVNKFPSAFLSLGLGIISVVLFGVGLNLHNVSRLNRELMDVLLKRNI